MRDRSFAYACYQAVLHPWLWLLTRTSDCRIFQNQNVQQIVEAVFADYAAVAQFRFKLTRSHRPGAAQHRHHQPVAARCELQTGRATAVSFDFERPAVSLLTQQSLKRGHRPS